MAKVSGYAAYTAAKGARRDMESTHTRASRELARASALMSSTLAVREQAAHCLLQWIRQRRSRTACRPPGRLPAEERARG